MIGRSFDAGQSWVSPGAGTTLPLSGSSDLRSVPFSLTIYRPLGKPLDPSVLTRNFQKLVKKAGLQAIRLHDLRHGHAGGSHHRQCPSEGGPGTDGSRFCCVHHAGLRPRRSGSPGGGGSGLREGHRGERRLAKRWQTTLSGNIERLLEKPRSPFVMGEKGGGPAGIRTLDTRIKSPM